MFTIYIENKLIENSLVTFNSGLNFNRFYSDDTIKNFSLTISKTEFLTKLNDIYDVVKTEIKIDDDMYNDSSEFSKVNYCSLEELLEKPTSLFEIFTTYLTDAFFVNQQVENAKYIINAITNITVEEHITLTGKVFVKN